MSMALNLRIAASLLCSLFDGPHVSLAVNNMCDSNLDMNVFCRLPTSFVKKTVFYAARDGMSKVLCSAIADRPLSETPELVEQEVVDKHGQILTPLIVAAKNGHITLVKILLNKYKVNIEHSGCVRIENFYIEGATALWCAAGAGHLSVVKVLVNAGADVNHTTKNHSTPIRAACYDGRLDIVKYLAMHGADVNKPNRYNNTCLMIASYKGHVDVVRFLLEHNVDPNQQAHCGATALFFAAECGHLEVVRELIKHGARLIPTDRGITPVMAAAERTRAEVVEYLVARCKLPIIDQINVYELLGASFANDKDNYCLVKSYYYLLKGMKLRYASNSEPILKVLPPPVEAYDNWVECQTLQELRAIQNNPNSLHMESLAIRERLLGSNNPEVPHPIIYRGAVFADNGRFDRCISLWIHALQLSINSRESLVKDLRRFAQIFSQMVFDGIELHFHLVVYILHITVMEIERTKLKMETSLVKDEIYQLKEELEVDLITSLYLIVIITKLIDNQHTDAVFRVYQLIFRLNKLQVTARGYSLLHLCCSADTPCDTFHTHSNGFPCAATAKLLIKCGADVNALDDDRNTPLHAIVNYQKPISDFATLHSIIKDLVDAGAHIDVVNSLGLTPLEAAATGVAEIIMRAQPKPTLQCLAARVVAKNIDDFENFVPSHLVNFVKMHAEIKKVTFRPK